MIFSSNEVCVLSIFSSKKKIIIGWLSIGTLTYRVMGPNTLEFYFFHNCLLEMTPTDLNYISVSVTE